MGNAPSENKTLLELCNEMQELTALYSPHKNNNIKISELNEKISHKIAEYKFANKLYSDDDLLEYETIIALTEKTNVFYKRDSSGITEIQYAFNSYLKAKIKHDTQIVLGLLSCFPSPESRVVGRFCFDNKINYQNFILYEKNTSLKPLATTKIYNLYWKLSNIASQNKFEIYLVFIKESSSIEVTMTNPTNNKRIKYIEIVTPYISNDYYIVEGTVHKEFELGSIASTLKS
jgi:hypothetical protein